MAVIKASEIGEYVYCHRAWWLHHIVGETPTGQARRAAGTRAHALHGAGVRRSSFFLLLGIVLLAAGLLILLLR